MVLEVQSVAELDPALVSQLQEEFTQIINDRYPQVDARTGPLHNLVLHLAGGIAGAINRTETKRVLDSRSLLAIEQDPNLADPELVDHVLSNFRITRRPGTNAAGTLSIVVTDNIAVVVPAGATYSANGVLFTVAAPFVAKPTGSQALATSERVLVALGGNAYSFTIPAIAVSPGAAGNIRRGTRLQPTTVPERFVSATAATDFSGGSDTELNAALIERLQQGIADKSLQGRVNIIAMLNATDEFGLALGYSIRGFGSPEMIRDQHSIWPGSLGGRVDMYARMAPLPLDKVLSKTATLVERGGAGDLWQFSMDADDAPGFYEIVGITAETDVAEAAMFSPTEDTRGFDLTGAPAQRDIVETSEAAYSRYQTAVIRFLNGDTVAQSLAVGATSDYNVIVRYMPQIAALQDYVDDAGRADLFGDILVKAPVPCFVTIECVVEYDPSTAAPAASAIQTAVAAAVNALNFPGRLYAATVSEAVTQLLTDKQAVSRIAMRGRIRRPDGETVYVQGTDIMEMPAAASLMTTGNTIGLVAYPEEVLVTLSPRVFGAGY